MNFKNVRMEPEGKGSGHASKVEQQMESVIIKENLRLYLPEYRAIVRVQLCHGSVQNDGLYNWHPHNFAPKNKKT